jgi:hypothetical protein
MKKIILSISLLATSVFAQEGGLKMSFNFENANVLPVGIRNVRYMNAHVEAITKYDGNGVQVPVGNALNKEVTWQKVIDGKKDPYEQAILAGTLKAYGVDPSGVIGSTTGMVNISVEAKVPVIAYGVTKKWTMALAVPYITSTMSIDEGFMSAKSLENFAVNQVQGKRLSQHKAYKLRTDTLGAISKKLSDNGYKTLNESLGTKSHIGDIKLVNKYQYLKKDKIVSALRFEIGIPTGKTLDVNKAVDFATGDGQWDIGLGNAIQINLTEKLSLTGFASYTKQLEKTDARRVPIESDSKISDVTDIDHDTKIKFGDQYKLQAQMNYKFYKGGVLNFITGLTYAKKYEDKVTGDKFEAHRYKWLTQDTEQVMKSLQAGFGVSTIPLFKAKKFKAPLQANLFYTSVYDGKNVVKDNVYTFEMALFF